MNVFKICVPVSHLFEGSKRLQEDLVSLADTLEIRRLKAYPLLREKEKIFHSSHGIIDHDFISFLEEDNVFDYLKENDINYFSFDLGPACEYNQFVLPLSRTLEKEEILDIAGERIDYIRERFSGLIAVENYNYYRTGLFEHICEPGFISEFVEKYDLKFLLDLAHAEISAHNLKYDYYSYLDDLPLDRVVEIHLSRPFIHPFLAVDAHGPPSDKDFMTLDRILSKIGSESVVYVVVEYYKDEKKLLDAYRDLKERLQIRS